MSEIVVRQPVPPKTSMPDLETLRHKLAKARRMVNEFQVASMNPAHSPEKPGNLASPDAIGTGACQTAEESDRIRGEHSGTSVKANVSRRISVQRLDVEAINDLMARHGRKQKIEGAWE